MKNLPGMTKITLLLLSVVLLFTGCTRPAMLLFTACSAADVETLEPVTLPVLMYHHFTEEPPDIPNANMCSAETFRAHLTMLQTEGYTTVTFADVLAFWEEGTPLPDKPILLTSDDGYTSVLTIALPLLTEFDMCMSVGVIGSMMGRDTGLAHFSLDEWNAAPEAPDRLELISHTWDMHDWNDAEQGVLGTDGTVLSRIATDTAIMHAIPALNQAVFVYPYGQHSAESEKMLAAMGYRITVTTRHGIAKLQPDETGETWKIPRIGVHDGIDGEMLRDMLS